VTQTGEEQAQAAATPSALAALEPLAGVRVIELCWIWAGPLFGQLLADLGAEVVKVEWYRRFDPYRTRGVERLRGIVPEARRRESSQSFHGLNRNKVSFAVDVKDEDGLSMVHDLVRRSDVLIENFTVGTLERLGLGYDTLGELNPKLVVVSLSGFGEGSRLEAMRAYGLVLSALAGAESDVADDGEFLGSPTFVSSDPNAALFGLLAATAGILHARRGGSGGAYRCSQLEAIAALVQAQRPAAGESWEDVTVETSEGDYVAVSVLAGGPTRDEIARLAEECSTNELLERLHALGAAAAPVLPVDRTADSPYFADLAVQIRGQHPVTGPELLVAAPWRVNGQRPPLRKTAPTLGEGDEYVLGTVLGYSDEDVERRRQREPARGSALTP
jgi:crotonobetainyl-CoA:carnitine CoA-transferase CaiB-like acyl-CoA transferase